MAAKMPASVSYLVYYVVWRVNLSKLCRKLEYEGKQQLYNCRVASFIDLYFLFPTNFRSVFLPNTNNKIY